MKVIYSHLSHYIKQHCNTSHILCIRTNVWLILALVLAFLFLFHLALLKCALTLLMMSLVSEKLSRNFF